MLVRFSEEGEGAEAEEEDIVVKVRGRVRCVGGEKSENTRKPRVYIGTKRPQPMGKMSQTTQPIKHSPSNTAHQTQPTETRFIKHSHHMMKTQNMFYQINLT